MILRNMTAVLGLGMAFGLGADVVAAQDGNTAANQEAGATDTTGGTEAQGWITSSRIDQAMPGGYAEPQCISGTSLRKITRATGLLKTALEGKPEARAAGLESTKQELIKAITVDGQERNVAAWYTLGQTYIYLDDVIGADSAFQRVSKSAAGCRKDVDDLRYAIWAPLMNGGIALSRTSNTDSALVRFRKAAVIYPDKPHAAMNAGVIFSNAGPVDSAIVYFQKAADLADRNKPPMEEERNRATFNLAAMLQRENRHAEAVVALEKYLGWMPDDRDAKDALASSYRGAGQVEKAQALESQLLAAGGTDSTGDGKGAAPVASVVAMRLGVNFYNDKKYTEAADAFKKVVDSEPGNRDAIYNLANVYLALKDYPKLIEASLSLTKIEPMNEDVLQLLGTGYKLSDDIDNAVKIAEQVLAMPTAVTVKQFNAAGETVKLTMLATGRAAQTPAGKEIAPAPAALTFELLDNAGTVVATQETQVPALKPDETNEFVVEGKGKGIVAWRYAVKR